MRPSSLSKRAQNDTTRDAREETKKKTMSPPPPSSSSSSSFRSSSKFDDARRQQQQQQPRKRDELRELAQLMKKHAGQSSANEKSLEARRRGMFQRLSVLNVFSLSGAAYEWRVFLASSFSLSLSLSLRKSHLNARARVRSTDAKTSSLVFSLAKQRKRRNAQTGSFKR